MDKGFRPWLWVAVAVLAIGGLVFAAQWLGKQSDERVVQRPDVSEEVESSSPKVVRAEHPPLSEALGVGESDFVDVGGVSRPKRDVAFDENKPKFAVSEKSPFAHPGIAPAVPKDTHPDVKGLFAELSKESPSPAAASSLFAPEPFDQKKYETDKESWLGKIRPGRAFQPAQPGPDVVPIQSKTRPFQQVVQGEKVILEVKAEPGSPVTFYTPEVGEFSNSLTTQSVEAADDGIASATYTATAGTQGLVNILAASPSNSGQLRFRVRVNLPSQN